MTPINLQVEDFSCIKTANVDLARFTLLIGPQASGKSLLSKLIYFFNSLAIEHRSGEDASLSFDAWKVSIRDRFSEWFPTSAWGSGKFRIEYQLGPYVVRFLRVIYDGKLTDRIRVWTSPAVEEFHVAAGQLQKQLSERLAQEPEFEFDYQLFDAVRSLFNRMVGGEYSLTQIFIPAGRSFFTSAGKAVTAFEHARLFDPVTLAFGKRLASYRDRGSFNTASAGRRGLIFRRVADILGGQIVSDRNGEFLKTTDGRKVPFGSLSSGQQELLPLLMVLDPIFLARRIQGTRFVCIEEPEAHLFPSAQSSLIELFAALVNDVSQNRFLVTTHSPYVLSKINNLIYAGELGARSDRAEAVGKVVSQRYWLPRPIVSAYALRDGRVCPIIDANGLIDGEYLDEVSGTIAREFNALLEIGAKQ